MSFYQQALKYVVDATGDGKSYHQRQEFNFNLKEGEVYAIRCPDEPDRYYRTVLLKKQGIDQVLKPMISNPVYGSIPAHMQEVSPEQVYRHMRMQNMQNLNAFPYGAYPYLNRGTTNA